MNKKNFYIPLIFFTSQILGLVAGKNLLPTTTTTPGAESPITGLYFLFMIGFVTALMLLLYKFKQTKIIKGWYSLAVFLTVYIFFNTFVDTLPALIPAAIVFGVRTKTDNLALKNVLDIFSYAGAGALFGSLIGFVPAIIFLIVLAVYDFISVNITGHMVDLALEGLDTDTFMGIVFTHEPGDEEKLKEKPASDESVEVVDKTENKQEIGLLGGGDVIAPMVLSVSLLKSFPLYVSITTALGSTLGIIYIMTAEREQKFLPAIPILATSTFVGLGVGLLLTVLM